MKASLLCVILSCLSLCGLGQPLKAPVLEAEEEWNLWKSAHEKSYTTTLEELEKHIVWRSNKAYVDQHNLNAEQGVYSYQVKLNHFADLTDKDYHERYLTYKRTDWSEGVKSGKVKYLKAPTGRVIWPESIDWRTRGAVSDVQTQAGCGASYAFATTGTLESLYSLAYDTAPVPLSEQNLIDCSVPEGNNGCNGGNMYNSFMYIISNDGIDTEKAYKYQGTQNTCNFTVEAVGASMSYIIAIQSGNEVALQAAITYAGPVAAAVDARSIGFRFYSGGIFDSSYCSSHNINHAMLIVGYGRHSYNGYAKEYWILKNSWGKDWGTGGYIWMTKNQYNQCGIATDCSYPSL